MRGKLASAKFALTLAGALGGCVIATAPAVRAQSAVHKPGVAPTHAADFGGIWAFGGGPRPVGSAATAPPPPYKPDWMATYQANLAKAARGERVGDPDKTCWPQGMPGVNGWNYPGEILLTPGQVTMLTEYENQTRRIFTDGRGHPPPDELEPTLRGHSIGHWEGQTLVVDTVGIRKDTPLGLYGRHSSKLHVIERIRLLEPNKLEWVTTLEDPIAFVKPWVQTRVLTREPADSEIREYNCLENQTADTFAPSTATIVWPADE